ncbi:RNA polymerase sigma factor [Belliella kenyensis]|uniref:RNA polymerase sigma factor n=1 Tax=Belliella kenyensis TaxID=1472724 RepID=A0ABV8EPF1_9BACT|nr:sigma-70 family RNA polymerase sigma factor [Belliella kenyensis]MCH7400710.1 sigma-70 family RNA polymerase sigma factor [Belliella kenyensis]MDN3602003.1 sigma-70 family RNA polymerase sigma factor [Belliella kenyensis]
MEMKEHALRQLVEDLSKGDEKAFGKLYQLFGEKVYHIARKMNLNHEDAEGVVQEVFLKIWKKRENLDPELSINAYMIAIVRSLVIKKVKKEARFFAYQKYKIPLISFETNTDPELELIYADFHQVSSDLIELLPPGQKQVFIMKNFENLSTDEIAEKLNLSKRTVENQIFRASKGIKEKLQKLKIISAGILLLILNFNF